MKLRTADEADSCDEAKNMMKMGAANKAENSVKKQRTADAAKEQKTADQDGNGHC